MRVHGKRVGGEILKQAIWVWEPTVACRLTSPHPPWAQLCRLKRGGHGEGSGDAFMCSYELSDSGEKCARDSSYFFSPYNVTISPFFPLWFSSVFLSKHPEFAPADSLNRGSCLDFQKDVIFTRTYAPAQCSVDVCVCVSTEVCFICIKMHLTCWFFYECVCVCVCPCPLCTPRAYLWPTFHFLFHIQSEVWRLWRGKRDSGTRREKIWKRGKTLPVFNLSLTKCKFVDLMKLDAAFIWRLFCQRRSRL